MSRTVGTVTRGIIAPIIKKGDDLAPIVVDSLMKAAESENFSINDRDVLGITESILARAQGNYVTIEAIKEDIEKRYPGDIGLIFPILSRNRFSILLKGIMATGKKVYLMLSYPSDEVGNHLMDIDLMDDKQIDPYTDVLTEQQYREIFGEHVCHPFTGVDYVKLYKEIGGDNLEIIFSNNPKTILSYTKDVLIASVHTRFREKRILTSSGANIVHSLDDIMTTPVNGSGFNPEFGLLGSNLSNENEVKLFPRDSQPFVDDIQRRIKDLTGKTIEVLVFGDGAFKDPVGKIWELADPVVSPGFTSGLNGTPNEIKLKYLVDTELDHLSGQEVISAAKDKIKSKDANLINQASSLGTTPRQLPDLLGSLCDLTTGSGDKGTPMVYIQGYFDNFASEK